MTEQTAAPPAVLAAPPAHESAQTDKLVAALAVAQGKFLNPHKDRENPHYKNKYATLDALIDATRPHLAAEGLAITQQQLPGGRPDSVALSTKLRHTSGQWIESVVPLFTAGKGAQVFGSEMTYMRRYCYAALLSITADEDDDAAAASGQRSGQQRQQPQQQRQQPATKPAGTAAKPASVFRVIRTGQSDVTASNGEALVDWWKKAADKAKAENQGAALKALVDANAPAFAALAAAGHDDIVVQIRVAVGPVCPPAAA